MIIRNTILVCSLAVGAVGNTAAVEKAGSLPQALSEGTTKLLFRYRYEYVDQDGLHKSANASTLKSRLSWQSASYKNVTAGLEFDHVLVVGDERYRTPGNGQTEFPIVADPAGSDVNQAYLRYTDSKLTATAGRQRILHDAQRFVGGVGWRQNEQTYDALRLQLTPTESVSVDYSYIWRVNRIFGPEESAAQARTWRSGSHALTSAWKMAPGHTLKAYTYLLDFDEAAGLSSATYGVAYQGAIGKLGLSAAYASQSDYADNPIDYSADYYALEASYKFPGVKLMLGMETLSSDEGQKAFTTPLATLHKFQGWNDKFLATPATGIEDRYVKVAAGLGEAKALLAYHDIQSDEAGTDYGSEINAVITYPLTKNITAQLKYSHYNADMLATDTDKLWLTFTLKY